MTWRVNNLLSLILVSGTVYSQDSLSLQDVVSATLKSNYDLKIQSLVAEQTGNLSTKGQAGYFPSVSFNGSGSYSRNNTKLEFAGGLPTVERDGAENTSVGANVGLNYILFNGFGRISTYKNLQNQYQLSLLQSRLVTENSVMESVSSVLQVQQLYIQIELAQENIEISKERLEYSIYRKESGVGNSIEVNAAQVDLGTDSLALIQLEISLKKELNRLKLLLGVDMDTQLKIKNEIPVPVLGSAEELGESVKSNTQILISQLNELVALENTKLANSRRLPVLGMNINYGYNSSQNGAGIILSQQTDGFSGSASLSIPIFNGLQLATAIKNAQIQEQIAGISNQYTELQIQQLLNDAILDQSLLEESILLQEKREKLATLNVSRSLEAFKNGQLRFTEVRENQLNLLQSRMAINQSRLSLVLLRYQILRLTGKLLN